MTSKPQVAKQELRDKIRLIVKTAMSDPFNTKDTVNDFALTDAQIAIEDLISEQKIAHANSLIGEGSGSDMNDEELTHSLMKMYQWGIGTGRKLEAGKIKKVDDRDWEMVASKLDQFEQTFSNRLRRDMRKRNV